MYLASEGQLLEVAAMYTQACVYMCTCVCMLRAGWSGGAGQMLTSDVPSTRLGPQSPQKHIRGVVLVTSQFEIWILVCLFMSFTLCFWWRLVSCKRKVFLNIYDCTIIVLYIGTQVILEQILEQDLLFFGGMMQRDEVLGKAVYEQSRPTDVQLLKLSAFYRYSSYYYVPTIIFFRIFICSLLTKMLSTHDNCLFSND